MGGFGDPPAVPVPHPEAHQRFSNRETPAGYKLGVREGIKPGAFCPKMPLSAGRRVLQKWHRAAAPSISAAPQREPGAGGSAMLLIVPW